jgi:hypothetical protein
MLLGCYKVVRTAFEPSAKTASHSKQRVFVERGALLRVAFSVEGATGIVVIRTN